jgi:hypothetical protein
VIENVKGLPLHFILCLGTVIFFVLINALLKRAKMIWIKIRWLGRRCSNGTFVNWVQKIGQAKLDLTEFAEVPDLKERAPQGTHSI